MQQICHLPQVPASHHWISGRRDQHLLLHFISSTSCREQWGDPSASFSPKQKNQVLSHSSEDIHSSPFTSFFALLWRHSMPLKIFLICGAQNYTQHRWKLSENESKWPPNTYLMLQWSWDLMPPTRFSSLCDLDAPDCKVKDLMF